MRVLQEKMFLPELGIETGTPRSKIQYAIH